MKRKTDRGRMKFRAFMVCVLSFLVVTGSACFLNREQEKEEKLKAVYAAESTVSRVKSQLNRYLAESELVKNIIESGYDIDGEKFSILSQMMQDKQNVIEAHELAKDGIVSHIYPMKGNEEAMGLNAGASGQKERGKSGKNKRSVYHCRTVSTGPGRKRRTAF